MPNPTNPNPPQPSPLAPPDRWLLTSDDVVIPFQIASNALSAAVQLLYMIENSTEQDGSFPMNPGALAFLGEAIWDARKHVTTALARIETATAGADVLLPDERWNGAPIIGLWQTRKAHESRDDE